jgi:hypothetical protein
MLQVCFNGPDLLPQRLSSHSCLRCSLPPPPSPPHLLTHHTFSLLQATKSKSFDVKIHPFSHTHHFSSPSPTQCPLCPAVASNFSAIDLASLGSGPTKSTYHDPPPPSLLRFSSFSTRHLLQYSLIVFFLPQQLGPKSMLLFIACNKSSPLAALCAICSRIPAFFRCDLESTVAPGEVAPSYSSHPLRPTLFFQKPQLLRARLALCSSKHQCARSHPSPTLQLTSALPSSAGKREHWHRRNVYSNMQVQTPCPTFPITLRCVNKLSADKWAKPPPMPPPAT